MTDPQKHLPCPECGSASYLIASVESRACIRCADCYATGPTVMSDPHAAWNEWAFGREMRRHYPDAFDGAIVPVMSGEIIPPPATNSHGPVRIKPILDGKAGDETATALAARRPPR